MSAPKKPRPRTQRRVDERNARSLVRDRERLALLEPGGSSDRPIRLESSVLVERRARVTPCPQCGGELNVEEHGASIVKGERFREVKTRCRICGVPRTLWFSVEPQLGN